MLNRCPNCLKLRRHCVCAKVNGWFNTHWTRGGKDEIDKITATDDGMLFLDDGTLRGERVVSIRLRNYSRRTD